MDIWIALEGCDRALPVLRRDRHVSGGINLRARAQGLQVAQSAMACDGKNAMGECSKANSILPSSRCPLGDRPQSAPDRRAGVPAPPVQRGSLLINSFP